jgi:hypothetical protein
MAAASLTYGRAILGRGCDPARAAHASKAWAPLLKCDVVCCTDDEALAAHLTSGVKFKAFFIAPGYCSLAKERRVGACGMSALCAHAGNGLLTRAPQTAPECSLWWSSTSRAVLWCSWSRLSTA